jgi:hypothetical protein
MGAVLSWLIQIYAVTDDASQELIAGLLSGIEGLTVESPTSGAQRFVVVECSDSLQAGSVFKLVTSIDFGARLVHTATNGAVTQRDLEPSKVA